MKKQKINVVIPMAGLGSRFTKAGYDLPKPFIDVRGKPMIFRVLENLTIPNAEYFLIIRKEFLLQYFDQINLIKNKYNVTFIEIDKLTEGSACTVLFARNFINNDNPLLIANSDQIIDININDFLKDMFDRSLDGSILTFIDEEQNPKWSFAKIDFNNYVIEVKEKKAISKYATVGIYLFKNGKDFVNYSIDMIIENERVNNEFYTCPVYNYAIKDLKKIGIFNIKHDQMHGIGTPEDLLIFLNKNKDV